MSAARIPERHRLERSFARARWLAIAALVVLAIVGGWNPWALWLPVVLLTGTNVGIWQLSSRAPSLGAQQRLGVAAVLLDGCVAWLVVLLVAEELVPSIYAVFVLVVVEASVRFAPAKALPISVGLIGSLAAAMTLRGTLGTGGFDALLFAFWVPFTLLVGTLVGTAVREVYRHRRDALLLPLEEMDDAIMKLLTRREQQVLAMISAGESNAHIAEALHIERKTVKNHINSIYSKLHLTSRYEAITRILSQRRRAPTSTTSVSILN
jgi:DNA-binding CsgD family transcriptional regulator